MYSEALEKGVSEMYGSQGFRNHIFFQKFAVTVDNLGFFFACFGQVLDRPHCTSAYITGCLIWGGGGTTISTTLVH